MQNGETIIEKIQRGHFRLRRSEQKVANWIIENSDTTTSLNITTIAKEIGVSEPTIVRFCRAIGCKGYQDFKIKFAEDLAYMKVHDVIEINTDDCAASVKAKVAQYARTSLTYIDKEIDTDQLILASDYMLKAKRAVICGFGASNCIAYDGFHKLYRITEKVEYHQDMHCTAKAVGSLQEDDVLIAISNSGRSQALISMAKLARSNGAKVITITDPGSALDQIASARLNLKKQSDTGLFIPMAYRLKQLTVIDFLVYNYARLTHENAQLRLEKTKAAVKGLKQQYSII